MEIDEFVEKFCSNCDKTYDCDCFWADSIVQCSNDKNIKINGLMELIL